MPGGRENNQRMFPEMPAMRPIVREIFTLANTPLAVSSVVALLFQLFIPCLSKLSLNV